MRRRGTTMLLAITTGIGVAAAAMAGCGVKAPPRPPLRDVQPAPAVLPPGGTGPSGSTGPTGPSGPSGSTGAAGAR